MHLKDIKNNLYVWAKSYKQTKFQFSTKMFSSHKKMIFVSFAFIKSFCFNKLLPIFVCTKDPTHVLPFFEASIKSFVRIICQSSRFSESQIIVQSGLCRKRVHLDIRPRIISASGMQKSSNRDATCCQRTSAVHQVAEVLDGVD